MASLAVGTLAINAPVAQALEIRYDCSFDAVQQDDATGQNYEGAAWGYAADDTGAEVSIRCYITVNGAPAGAEASDGPRAGLAVARGPISFTATPEDDVDICADVNNGAIVECFQSEHQQIPPQEVIDAINAVVIEFVDPTLCSVVLAPLAGTYGPIFIDPEGDVYIDGEPQWDCPPYDIWPPA